MHISSPVELTQQEVSQDVQSGIKEAYGMTVLEFLKAIESGLLNRADYAVRELVGWMNTLPDDDPAFNEVRS